MLLLLLELKMKKKTEIFKSMLQRLDTPRFFLCIPNKK